MTIPNAKISKADGNTGVVRPGTDGICAIIAPCEKGTANQPSSYADPVLALNDFGYGILTDGAAYEMDVSGNPALLIRATASTAGVMGAVTTTGGGSSVITATGAAAPLDDFDVIVTFIAGGTRGSAGITYTYSLDGGVTTSAVQALGTAVTLAIPKSGVSFDLATGTVLAGETIECPCTGPRLTTGDISTALEALRVTNLPWEWLLVLGHDATNTTVTIIDTWLAAREAEGVFRGFTVNARPLAVAESEATYATAMGTAWNATASIRGCVCAESGDLASVLPGRAIVQARPTALAFTARLMSISLGRSAAYVQDGPVAGFGIADVRGNPKHHDENKYPGLNDLRLVTLRSFDRKQGVFITRPNVISTTGSDFVLAQHARTMNRACEIAYDVLTNQIQRGIRKNAKPGPNGAIYIAEDDALAIEALVNQAQNELRSEVTDLRFALSRTDDIGANGPTTLTGRQNIVSLAYVDNFNVTAAFARSITVQK